jgi:hypothetical protein
VAARRTPIQKEHTVTLPLLIITTLTIALGGVSAWMAAVDARADRAHRAWMARNEERRARTRAEVKEIRRGTWLDTRRTRP